LFASAHAGLQARRKKNKTRINTQNERSSNVFMKELRPQRTAVFFVLSGSGLRIKGTAGGLATPALASI
jgi:hypothetical protein